MYGPFVILLVDMYRVSTTSLHRSSKFSFLHILVCDILVFCSNFHRCRLDSDPENFDPSVLPKKILDAIEADSFWCLSRLLDGIQDNYIFAQPGIVRSVKRMAELVSRIDGRCINPACRAFSLIVIARQLLYTLIWNFKTWNSCSLRFGG